jgi:galactose mutarotase-like enzyme
MGTITSEQRQHLSYLLTTPGGAHLEVVPERGGIILGWQVGDRTLLYLDTDRYANPSLSIRGGIPILFPICGNLVNDTYMLNGKAYTLKQHGFARDLPWRVIDQQTGDPVSITLGLESNEQTRAVYPFDFELAFTYRLFDTALELHQRYTNRSPETMPFAAGFHPYFPVADKTQLAFEIPGSEYTVKQTQAVHPFDGSFDFNQDEIDVAFQGVTGTEATVSDRRQATKLTLSYSQAFSTLVFWTVKGKDFYCLEPWTAPRNALNTGDSLLHLEPGASLELMFRLSVEG